MTIHKSKIRSIAEAVGIISKEVRESVSDDKIRNGHCVECDAIVTHPGAYFCEECAPVFYNEKESGADE